MNKYNLILGLSLLLASCGGKTEGAAGKDAEKLKAEIRQMDDSLRVYYAAVMQGETTKVPSASIQKAIDMQMRFYHTFSKDAYAAECLDKVHQLYMQEKSYVKSVQACDTLVAKYPDYKDMNVVLLSAGTTYDYMLNDQENAKKYYEMILKHPKIDKETKESIAFRLKNLDKSLDEMAEMQ